MAGGLDDQIGDGRQCVDVIELSGRDSRRAGDDSGQFSAVDPAKVEGINHRPADGAEADDADP